MNKIINIRQAYIYLAVALVCFVGSCSHSNRHIDDTLRQVELLLEESPDSALYLLEGIEENELTDKRQRAHHGLLMSIALDKNYIDTTTFEILQPAIDFYPKQGSANEKLRTYYYKARIHQNRCDNDSAMKYFLEGINLRDDVSDSLTLARTYVAIGTLNIRQYKVAKFIENNLDAAALYGGVGKYELELKSYINAMDGYVMLMDKDNADKMIVICKRIMKEHPDTKLKFHEAFVPYTLEFGSDDDIKSILYNAKEIELDRDNMIDFASGYSKLGNHDEALQILADVKLDGNILDSLKYLAVKATVLENKKEYKQALITYKDYSSVLDAYQHDLMSEGLLFAEEKHQLEIDNLNKIQRKDKLLLQSGGCLLVLAMIVIWLYYGKRDIKNKREITVRENENLRLNRDILLRKKENAELRCAKKSLEASVLEKEKQRLEAEQRQRLLESENMRLEILQLEEERDKLKVLVKNQNEISKPMQKIINDRLEMLNCVLAKEITNNDNYIKPYSKWISEIRDDKQKFLNSTRILFRASHPNLISYMENHGLTESEINYICLYAMGLRGKDVGEFIKLKRHYNISSEIRKKLGMDEHDTNIGIFIRRLMKEN